jgi:hypothetical protein
MLLSSADRQLMIDARNDLHEEIRAVAEGVLAVDEKLGHEAADIRAEMREGFADVAALFRFSYGDLDRRLRTLEEGGAGA